MFRPIALKRPLLAQNRVRHFAVFVSDAQRKTKTRVEIVAKRSVQDKRRRRNERRNDVKEAFRTSAQAEEERQARERARRLSPPPPPKSSEVAKQSSLQLQAQVAAQVKAVRAIKESARQTSDFTGSYKEFPEVQDELIKLRQLQASATEAALAVVTATLGEQSAKGVPRGLHEFRWESGAGTKANLASCEFIMLACLKARLVQEGVLQIVEILRRDRIDIVSLDPKVIKALQQAGVDV
ncbi:hypothetical protein CYMTET_8786 [Cymbomonas tetramitiformis]|uniref:Uncharacterized protein n=1 Tax=Cymbomonas tetramitiformis TaxID=36881 RepID=A0AAE0GSR0_9CHLO|nr:hypothetical protein CYMTET_8786 [Cymbomonas tetramitiformis]